MTGVTCLDQPKSFFHKDEWNCSFPPLPPRDFLLVLTKNSLLITLCLIHFDRGLILQDLTFIHLGNPDELAPGIINFRKRWQQFNILDTMRRFKQRFVALTIFFDQWFPNCGTRRPSQWYTNRPTFCFLHKKTIHSYNFYLSGSVNKFLNFCEAYLACWFLKMTIILPHSHFLHVTFVSIMVFQTFDRIIFGTLTFHGIRWYVLTARDPQMVRDQKKVWEPLS